jgi:hypothetical protein
MKKFSYLAVAALFAVTIAFTSCNNAKTETTEGTEQVDSTTVTTPEVTADSTQTVDSTNTEVQ